MDLAEWLMRQGANDWNLPDAFLNDLAGDLTKFHERCDLPYRKVELKSDSISYGRAILFLSKVLDSSRPRAFNIGRCFNPEMVPGAAREINQLDVSFRGEHENLASAKGIISHLATMAIGEFTEITILPTKLSFISPSGMVRIECRLCKGSGCAVCSNKGMVAIGVLGVVRSSIYKCFKPTDGEAELANYVGLNIDVLAVQRRSLASQDSLYG